MLSTRELNAVYRESRQDLLALARRGVPSSNDAEDVLHDAFVSFLQAAPEELVAPEAGAYLRRCVVTAIADWWREAPRREKNAAPIERRAAAPARQDPFRQVAVKERLARMQAAVARLPDRQRQAVMLRYLAEMPTRRVAADMHCQPATVRSLVRHALARLTELLRTPDKSAVRNGDTSDDGT
jgi:RNA polymerase sigma factor (sigma-70 family)